MGSVKRFKSIRWLMQFHRQKPPLCTPLTDIVHVIAYEIFCFVYKHIAAFITVCSIWSNCQVYSQLRKTSAPRSADCRYLLLPTPHLRSADKRWKSRVELFDKSVKFLSHCQWRGGGGRHTFWGLFLPSPPPPRANAYATDGRLIKRETDKDTEKIERVVFVSLNKRY